MCVEPGDEPNHSSIMGSIVLPEGRACEKVLGSKREGKSRGEGGRDEAGGLGVRQSGHSDLMIPKSSWCYNRRDTHGSDYAHENIVVMFGVCGQLKAGSVSPFCNERGVFILNGLNKKPGT